MSIQAGTYFILANGTGQAVGRNMTEDKSLHPKRVLLFPGGVRAEAWTIERDPDSDQFILKARGAPTADIDGKVFAILTDIPPPTRWELRPVPGEENVYIITLFGDSSRGWVAPSAAYDQIMVQPLQGHATEYFEIAPAPA